MLRLFAAVLALLKLAAPSNFANVPQGGTSAAPAASAAGRVQAVDLQSEYLTDPLGLDTAKPRLSWALRDPAHVRGQKQTAFRVLVDATPDRLARQHGDLWDSGKVNSDTSVGVEYAGAPLPPGTVCFWKVQVWDSSGRPTAWSAPARFSVGLLSDAGWRAAWIGMASAGEQECPWFRKAFTLDRVPETALAYVGSIGFHELYVNGHKVGDQVLTPSVSDLRKRALYCTYDIRPYLHSGQNVAALWLAPGWSQFSDANPDRVSFNLDKKPLGIAQIQFGPPCGPFTRLVTDDGWRCSLSTTRHIGRWQNSDFGGDHVDASRDAPGWNAAGFDDSGWEKAAVYHPNRTLSPDVIEPNRKCERIPAKELRQIAPGKYRFVMSRLFAGWVEVKLKGSPGVKATIKVSSLPDRELEYNQQNEFVIGSSGTGVFCNRFSYHECGFVTVEGLENAPVLEDLVGYRVSNDRPRIGRFDCSNPLVKRIYDTTVNTYENLTTGGMTVDCPHRERLGYGGDGHTSLEIALDTFASDAFFMKWAQDWCDMQLPGGRIYHTAPTMGGGGGPAWSGFILTMPWEVYQTVGDTRILERVYPFARKWLDYMEGHVGPDGLVQPLPGGYWLFLGDWVTPHGSEGSDQPEALLFNNCYYLYVTRLAARIARILGHPADEREYAVRAKRAQQALNRRFFNTANAAYLDTRQTHCVLPLISGAVPPERVPDVLANLEHEIQVSQKGHLDTGLHGTYFMTRYLTDCGRSDLVFTYATQPTFPGYDDLLARGYETWPEEWKGSSSRLHGCLNGIGGWFQRGLAGIRTDPVAPGYRRFFVKPAVVGDLTWVQAHHDSPYGRIESNWRLENQRLTLDVTVPPNTSATIWVPAADAGIVLESGKPAEQARGVRFLRSEKGASVFAVEAGVYRFTSRR